MPTTSQSPGLYPHDGKTTCLCSDCVYKHSMTIEKEPHPDFPDCDNCYLQFNHVLYDHMLYWCPLHEPPPAPKKIDSRRADPNQEYTFTLTMPPSYEPKKPIEEVARLILENGLTNKPYEKACEYAFVKEHTEQGTPHIHGVYKTPTGRRIACKYFNRYWPLWDEKKKMGQGFQGGYHSPARHSESYHAYLEKEGVVTKSNQ